MSFTKKSLFFICVLSVFFLLPHTGFSQNPGQPQPPPIDIEFIAPANPQINQELTITIKIIPYQDVQPEIFCILPFGVEPIPDKNTRIISYRQMPMPVLERHRNGRFFVNLWVDPMKTLETKEFSFRVKIRKKGSYELICLLAVSAAQSEKEKSFTLKVN